MFVETKKEGEAQVEQLSLAGFIAWLEIQPADQAYDYSDPQHCAWGQYSKSLGVPPVASLLRLPDNLLEAWLIARPRPWTFGAAFERARQYAAQ